MQHKQVTLIRLEVLMAVKMLMLAFSVVMPCGLTVLTVSVRCTLDKLDTSLLVVLVRTFLESPPEIALSNFLS
jgi:hypothetical protein